MHAISTVRGARDLFASVRVVPVATTAHETVAAATLAESQSALIERQHGYMPAPAVMQPVPEGTQLSIESGAATEPGQKGPLADRSPAAFLQGMPPVFRNTLSPRLARRKVCNVEPTPGPDDACSDVQAWRNRDDVEVRHALVTSPVTLMRPRVNDPGFRATLIKNMAHHPEWNAVPGR